jgi:methionyl-tRNA formyltransferase
MEKKKIKIVIAAIKSWNISNAQKFIKRFKECEVMLITKKNDFVYKKIKSFEPSYIFLPHWSWVIPEQIFNNFESVVFHMTDLPFGRGGSPLQNLIVRGFDKTKISAIKAGKNLDAGPIYLKRSLPLKGDAERIYKRASAIIFGKMIPFIIKNKLKPKKQKGKIVKFKRRVPKDSNISELKNVKQLYDYIRMMDAEGYPKAFIKCKNYIVRFKNAELKNNKLKAKAEFEVENEK